MPILKQRDYLIEKKSRLIRGKFQTEMVRTGPSAGSRIPVYSTDEYDSAVQWLKGLI